MSSIEWAGQPNICEAAGRLAPVTMRHKWSPQLSDLKKRPCLAVPYCSTVGYSCPRCGRNRVARTASPQASPRCRFQGWWLRASWSNTDARHTNTYSQPDRFKSSDAHSDTGAPSILLRVSATTRQPRAGALLPIPSSCLYATPPRAAAHRARHPRTRGAADGHDHPVDGQVPPQTEADLEGIRPVAPIDRHANRRPDGVRDAVCDEHPNRRAHRDGMGGEAGGRVSGDESAHGHHGDDVQAPHDEVKVGLSGRAEADAVVGDVGE